MRVRRTLSTLLFPAMLSMTGCIYLDVDGLGKFSRDFHFSYPMKAGARLSLDTFNGSVEISEWDQNTIDISGSKYAPTSEQADAIKVDVDHVPEMVSIRVERQYDWHGNRGVRFTIKVPRSTLLDRIVTSNGGIHVSDASGPARLKSSNGAIRVERLQGSLDAQTSNGGIELNDVTGDATLHSSNGRIRAENLRGALQAETSNGSISATVSSVDRQVKAETRNGQIDLTLPAGFTGGVRAHTNNDRITVRLADPVNARLTARTSNANVTCDFEARMSGELRRNEIDGQIGNGGMTIDLSTSNARIEILRR